MEGEPVGTGRKSPEAAGYDRGGNPEENGFFASHVGGAYFKRLTPADAIFFPFGLSQEAARDKPARQDLSSHMTSGHDPMEFEENDVCGKQVWEPGDHLLDGMRRVSKLCSQTTGGKSHTPGNARGNDTFPLPTLRIQLVSLLMPHQLWCIDWLIAVCCALNSLWGCHHSACQESQAGGPLHPMSELQARVIQGLIEDVTRMKDITETTDSFDWGDFFRTRTIDYKGDEVKTALSFKWANIRPALPQEIGVARLTDICEQGCRYYNY